MSVVKLSTQENSTRITLVEILNFDNVTILFVFVCWIQRKHVNSIDQFWWPMGHYGKKKLIHVMCYILAVNKNDCTNDLINAKVQKCLYWKNLIFVLLS